MDGGNDVADEYLSEELEEQVEMLAFKYIKHEKGQYCNGGREQIHSKIERKVESIDDNIDTLEECSNNDLKIFFNSLQRQHSLSQVL